MNFGKGIGWAATAFVALLAVAFVVIYGTGFLKQSTADFRGETGQREDTVADSDYRIAAYDHFYDLCASIQAQEQTLTIMEVELASNPAPERVAQINQNLTAVRNNRAALITQYNADARKEGTLAQFKSSDLPYEIDQNGETTCVSSE